jgi:hypothetical protein
MLISGMNSKQRKTLEAIFLEPVPKNLLWDDIESLLMAIGCKMKNRGGSRVGFAKDSFVLYVHRPHPQKETATFTIRDVKEFLERIGVTP